MLTTRDPTPIGLRPLEDLLPKAAPQTGPLPPGVAQGGWTSDQGFVAAHNWPTAPPSEEDT